MEEIATVYARALFEAASDAGRSTRCASSSPRWRTRSTLRAISRCSSSRLLLDAGKARRLAKTLSDADPLLINFLELLIENHRMPWCSASAAGSTRCGRSRTACCRCSHERDRARREAVAEIGERVGKQTGRRVELTAIVDPTSSAASSYASARDLDVDPQPS